jgi:alpha-tubulin suppressor-like RCC1 family protein
VLLVALLSLSVEGASIALGWYHSCALISDGKVKCLGLNVYGQLGGGSTTDSTTPVEVSNITTATSIALGYSYSCTLLTDGKVM